MPKNGSAPKSPTLLMVRLDQIAEIDGNLSIEGLPVIGSPITVHHSGPCDVPLILDFETESGKVGKVRRRLILTDPDSLAKVFGLLKNYPDTRSDILTGLSEEGLENALFRLDRNYTLLRRLISSPCLIEADRDAEFEPELIAAEYCLVARCAAETLRLARDVAHAGTALLEEHPAGDIKRLTGRVINDQKVLPTDGSDFYQADGTPAFKLTCLITATQSEERSPSLFATSFTDGTYGLLFSRSASARRHYLGITDRASEARYPDLNRRASKLYLGKQIFNTLGYVRRVLEDSRPLFPDSTADAGTAESFACWFADELDSYVKTVYLNVSEMLRSFGKAEKREAGGNGKTVQVQQPSTESA